MEDTLFVPYINLVHVNHYSGAFRFTWEPFPITMLILILQKQQNASNRKGTAPGACMITILAVEIINPIFYKIFG